MELPKELSDEIWEYCRLNNITNMDEFTTKMVQQGFTAEKFGSAPAGFGKEPKEVVKEVEVIKEVEVEKIVEKRVEVPVEKIIEKEVIKEIPVEKEIYITDDTKTNELVSKISELERLLEEKGVEHKKLKEEHALALKMANDELTSNLNGVLDDKQKMKEEYEVKIKELEEQLKKNKNTNTKTDIYGERGRFGSNLMD
jgi:hypothetical protein